ncbi:MAG: LeuA family protein, partial [Thermoplasmata archaeon]
MTEPPLVEDYHSQTVGERHFAPSIAFWDETLRDGEQMPGVHYSPEEKLRIAEKLSEVGVHIIDAGIPVVSPDEARSVSRLAHAGLRSK